MKCLQPLRFQYWRLRKRLRPQDRAVDEEEEMMVGKVPMAVSLAYPILPGTGDSAEVQAAVASLVVVVMVVVVGLEAAADLEEAVDSAAAAGLAAVAGLAAAADAAAAVDWAAAAIANTRCR